MQLRTAVVAAITLAASGAFAQSARPITAVFNVEARGLAMDAGVLDRLGDYLSGRLAASGAFQVVPRSQVKARLAEQKAESYKACYDQTCQIELGRDLAAEKTVSVEIMRLGSRCMTNLSLYDLRTSTAEAAGAAEGGCSEEEVVESVKYASTKLVENYAPIAARAAPAKPAAEPAAPQPQPVPTPPPPAQKAALTPLPREVFLDILYKPDGADVRLDGRRIGQTPVRNLRIAPGRYVLDIRKDGYVPDAPRVDASGDTRVEGALKKKPQLTVRYEPDGSLVYWENQKLGSTPLANIEVMPGQGTLRIEKWDHAVETKSVDLQADMAIQGSLRVDPVAQQKRQLATDWFRFELLMGTSGAGYGEFVLGGLKWNGGYLNVMRLGGGGGLVGTGFDLGVAWWGGPEAGWLYQKGRHYVAIGAGLGFGGAFLFGDHSGSAPKGAFQDRLILGFELTPSIRYRYYTNRFGFEVSFRVPMFIGKPTGEECMAAECGYSSSSGTNTDFTKVSYSTSVFTPMPVIGIGFGM